MTGTGQHYRLLERLGSGGMGDVFRAEDTRLHRTVALKLLRCPANEKDAEARLLREARAASALNHPSIATIYEIGEMEHEGEPRGFIAMEHVEGERLDHWAKRRETRLADVVRAVRDIADALADAHLKGVVHRDVKPTNVLVDARGRVKLLDFGLAKVAPIPGRNVESTPAFTLTGTLAGTIAYMSPEQVRGEAIDGRSDVFSLGVVLFELVAGRVPFAGESPAGTLDAILRSEAPPLLRFAPHAPAALDRSLRRMLEKDREMRPAAMADVVLELDAILHELTSGAPRGSEAETITGTALLRASAAPARSVAVVGFANVTKIPGDDWIGTGLAETVSSDLRSVPGFAVVGRERVVEVLRKLRAGGEADEERLAIATARELGARFLVSGGYQRLGEALRVTARFVDVTTGEAVRSVKLDGSVDRIFELQDAVVGELADGLSPAPPAGGDATAEETHVVAAYEAYSKAVINLRALSRDSLERAVVLFERAVELDPGYVRALVALGDAYVDKGQYLGIPELVERAESIFRRAIERRPRSAEAWLGLSTALSQMRRDDDAISAAERAIELDPGNGDAHAALARVHFIGKADFEKAARSFRKAIERNPQAGWVTLQLSHCLALLGRLDEAEGVAHRAIELQEQFLSGRAGFLIIGAYSRYALIQGKRGDWGGAVVSLEKELDFLRRVDHPLKDRTLVELRQRLGGALVRLGRREEAIPHLREALAGFAERQKMGADEPFTRYYAACAFALLGETERALDMLEAAARTRAEFTAARARTDPDFIPLREEPRFIALLQAVVSPSVRETA